MMRIEFAAYLLTIVIGLTLYLWPASFWYEIHAISIPDAPAGQVKVYVDRDIHRGFPGTWSATVRDLDDEILEGCAGSGQTNYSPEARKPGNTMQWWVGPSCFVPPGEWTLEIEVRNHALPVFTKYASARSGVFRVLHPDEPAPNPRVLKREIDRLGQEIQQLRSLTVPQDPMR